MTTSDDEEVNVEQFLSCKVDGSWDTKNIWVESRALKFKLNNAGAIENTFKKLI